MRAAHHMSATASQVGGAALSDWLASFRLVAALPWPFKRSPTPSVSEAARVLSAQAHASRTRTLRERQEAIHAKLQAEKDAGLVCGKPRP